MTKQDEIEILRRLAGETERAGADYLPDLLREMLPHFERSIICDFPAAMCIGWHTDQLREAADAACAHRDRAEALQMEIDDLESTIYHAREREEAAQRCLNEMRAAVREMREAYAGLNAVL